MKIRKKLCSLLVAVILCNYLFYVPVKANRDYLNITLADIIVTFYNASGVAIGDTELFNAIYHLYGNVTLGQMADAGIIYSDNPAIDTPQKVKEMLGFGNLTAPIMKVSQTKLQNLLGDLPTNNVATDALRAMFDDDIGTTFNNVVYHGLAGIVGMVAEIGKIGYGYYEKIKDWVTDPSDPLLINHSPFSTLKQAYDKFTDSTYFQDLVHPSGSGGTAPDPGEDGHYGYYLLNPVSDNWGFFRFDNGTTLYDLKLLVYSDIGCVCLKCNSLYYIYIVVPSYGGRVYRDEDISISKNAFAINNTKTGWNPMITSTKLVYSEISGNLDLWGGPRVFYIGEYESLPSNKDVTAVYKELVKNGPTITPSPVEPDGNGVTSYINNQVGNIASDNYINLFPNIGSREYITIINRDTYVTQLNQITNNTDNGNYSDNSTVINNYNTQYVENGIPDVRPSTVPAPDPEDQPAQPFVSPRPTQTPEFVESVVQEGGLSEEITKKFPFCIPWDIKALVDNLWAPEARAPYIHWEATFGEWGKLGEVTLDFSEFDSAARIFRSTTLLLWIVGLVLITRDLIG